MSRPQTCRYCLNADRSGWLTCTIGGGGAHVEPGFTCQHWHPQPRATYDARVYTTSATIYLSAPDLDTLIERVQGQGPTGSVVIERNGKRLLAWQW